MQNCGSALLAILESSQRDLAPVDLFEFYAPTETELFPENAAKRYAASEIVWFGWTYERQAISRGDVSRFIDGKFNNVAITLSNIDRSVSSWLSTTEIEGYRVVIRMISRSVDDDSVVLFVGRCEKPFDVDNSTVSITIKQDLGSIENDLPFNQFTPKCPLRFKGAECLAGQSLGGKSAAYQAASACNKTWSQCTTYANTKAFQGFRFNSVAGNFKVSKQRGGAGGALLSLLGIGNKRVTKQWSSQDDTPFGQSIPMGAGRTQIELTPVLSADTGEYLYGHWIVGEGEITKILNLRNVSDGWANAFQFSGTHLGKYGYDPDQESDSDFLGYEYYSHRAYAEATIKGENPDTGDPSPTLVATILWNKIATFEESCFTGVDWSDNPVEHVRWLLTEPRGLNYNAAWIDNEAAAQTAAYCNDPLIDQTGGEDVYVSTNAGTAGTDFKRYRSTGLLDTYYFRKRLGLDAAYPAEREVAYNSYNPSSPPANPTPATYYRKRYTSNWHIKEQVKAVDFIFKSLLPAFRGYLVTGASGKLQIRSERPTVTSYLLANASIGATTVAIEDAAAWKAMAIPVVYALIGVGEATSETRRVAAISFSTAGNSITLSAAGSGGITATASGGTFAGGTSAIQAQADVMIGGTPAAGAVATVTIDGNAVSYTLGADDTAGTTAALLAVRVNADATLSRYVEAIWTASLPEQVRLRSKLGTLTLAAGLDAAHDAGEIVAHVHMPFADAAFGSLSRGNVLRDSFKWPLGSRQSSHNQFVVVYNDAVQDYQPTELRENDYDHQDRINKVSKFEISGACVDNYHQANRLVLAARYKYREGNFFCSLASTGLALLLEEGDVICVNHPNMPGQRNLMLRVEELRVSQEHRVSLVGRLYADEQFPTAATERTVVLTAGIGWPSATPGAVTGLAFSAPASGTVRGSFTFAAFVGSQSARVEIQRPGDSAFSDTGIRVSPDANGQGAFEVTGLPTGITAFRITPYSSAGDGPATTSGFDPDAPTSSDILQAQVFDLPDDNLEWEVFD